MHDVRCQCCPYGYHLEMDFLQYLDDMYGPNVSRTLQQIEQRRHDVRRRLTEESSVSLSISESTSSSRVFCHLNRIEFI